MLNYLAWCLALVVTATAPAVGAFGQSVGSSSGISAASSSSSLAVPTPASIAGYNTNSFYDSTFSSIDRTNSLAPGFTWYTNNAFPNAYSNGTGWTVINTAPATPSSSIVVSGGTMELTTALNTAANTEMVNTCVWTGSSVIGTTFSGGFYVEVTMAYNPALSVSGNASWPIYWMLPEEFLNGSITTADFVELDGYECGPLTAACQLDMALHDWNNFNKTENTNSNYIVTFPGSPNLFTQNKYGTLYATAASNGGLGLIKRYFNRTLVPSGTMNFSASAAPNPAASPTNVVGSFSQLDNAHFCILIGTGPNIPNYITNVQVWTGTFNWTPTGPTINAPTASAVTDAAGNVWSFNAAMVGANYEIFKNGSWAYGFGAAVKLVIFEGVAEAQTATGLWYQDTGSTFIEVSP